MRQSLGPVPSLPLGPSLALFKAPCPGAAGLAGHCNCTVASTAFLVLNSGAAGSERLFSESGLDFPLGGALGVLTKAEKGNQNPWNWWFSRAPLCSGSHLAAVKENLISPGLVSNLSPPSLSSPGAAEERHRESRLHR